MPSGRILQTWSIGRVPHAWLITGPRGIGKATLAYRFARLALSGATPETGLFGATAPSLDVDPSSPVFRQVAAGAHPDLHGPRSPSYDEKTGHTTHEIVVDDVRRAVDFMHLSSRSRRLACRLVDSADEMNRNSANALA